VALAVFAAADLDAAGDAFGLGSVLIFRGRSLFHCLLLVPDDLSAEHRAELETWASGRTVATVLGAQPWQVVTRSEWFDPAATIERDPRAFAPRAYTGAGPVVGYDHGRFFGLTAEHFTARTGTARDQWSIWPPGWGRCAPGRGWVLSRRTGLPFT